MAVGKIERLKGNVAKLAADESLSWSREWSRNLQLPIDQHALWH